MPEISKKVSKIAIISGQNMEISGNFRKNRPRKFPEISRNFRKFPETKSNFPALAVAELQRFMDLNKVDVALLQETHLSDDDSLKLPGYEVRKKARKIGRDGEERAAAGKTGGVAIAIREGIDFQINEDQILAPNDRTTEAISATIYTGQSSTRLVNLYVPPIRTSTLDQRSQNFDPQHLPAGRRVIVAGDINGHSPAWEAGATTDSIGELVEDWIVGSDFSVLNDGSPTRRDFRTGGLTSPDVSLCSSALNRKITWKVADTLGSDHLPILMVIPTQRWNEIGAKRSKRLIYKKANWHMFRRGVVERSEEVDWDSLSVNQAQKEFCLAVIGEAYKSIPRGSRPGAKIWWDEELDPLFDERKEA